VNLVQPGAEQRQGHQKVSEITVRYSRLRDRMVTLGESVERHIAGGERQDQQGVERLGWRPDPVASEHRSRQEFSIQRSARRIVLTESRSASPSSASWQAFPMPGRALFI